MTITTTVDRVTQIGNGVTTVWNYAFLIPEGDEVITITDSAGTQTTLIAGQYTITGEDNPAGGTVTYPLSGSPLAAGSSITIQRVLAYTQETGLPNQEGFYPETIGEALDYITMLTQQLNGALTRVLQANLADSAIATLPVAAQRAGKFLAFDGSGNPIASDGGATGSPVSSAMAPVVSAATLALARTAMGIASFADGSAQVAGAILGNPTGVSAVPQFGTLTQFLDFMSSSQGAVVYRGGAVWAGLAPGSSGQFLKTQGAGANPTWAAVPVPAGFYSNLAVLWSTVAIMNITADVMTMTDGTSTAVYSSVSLSPNITASGANGLDTGAVANNTWYSVWVIAKADGTLAGLFSTSATAPTMPATYVFKRRVGWVRTNGAAQIIKTNQWGDKVYAAKESGTALRQLTSGVSGNVATPTWTAVAIGTFVPTTAALINLELIVLDGVAMVAPNNNYGAYNSAGLQAPLVAYTTEGEVSSVELPIEGANIYYTSNIAESYLNLLGWTDRL